MKSDLFKPKLYVTGMNYHVRMSALKLTSLGDIVTTPLEVRSSTYLYRHADLSWVLSNEDSVLAWRAKFENTARPFGQAQTPRLAQGEISFRESVGTDKLPLRLRLSHET